MSDSEDYEEDKVIVDTDEELIDDTDKELIDDTDKESTDTEEEEVIDEEVIDEAFVVRKSRFGLYNSFTVKGRSVLTGANEENVKIMTRWHLKCEQEGWPDGSVRVTSATKGIDL